MTENEKQGTTVSFHVLEVIMEKYGPYAFGFVMFLALWLAAVKPELDKKAIDFSKQQALVEQMGTVASSMERTAMILERTANVVARKERDEN